MLLLTVVLLLRERVDAAERLPPALEPLERRLQLFARAFGCVLTRLAEAAPRLRGLGIQPSELDLDLRDRRRGLVGLPPQLGLARGEVSEPGGQRRGERAAGIGARGERLLDARGLADGARELVAEPLAEGREAWVGRAHDGRRRRRALREHARLLAQAARLSLELELERLRGLAGEPQLPPLRVPAEALRRHGGDRRREQLGQRNHRQRAGELGGVLPHEHDQAAEPGRAGVLEQLEAAGGILDHDGRRAMAERRGHRRLASRLDVHRAQRQRLAPLRERAGRRRQALSLGERALDRDRPSPLQVAPARRASSPCLWTTGARSRSSRSDAASRRISTRSRALRRRYRAPAAPSCPPATAASSPSARSRSTSKASSRDCDISLRGLELGLSARLPHRLASILRQIERCEPGADAADLDAQLLGALGGARLERERPQPLLDLALEVAGALHLQRDARELQLGTMTTALEPSQPGRLLDERTPLARRRGEDRLHLALADDGAGPGPETHVREQLDYIGPPARSPR